jgi:hypothetical protein
MIYAHQVDEQQVQLAGVLGVAGGGLHLVAGRPARGSEAPACRAGSGRGPSRGAGPRLGVDVEVIITPPCIYCIDNHE